MRHPGDFHAVLGYAGLQGGTSLSSSYSPTSSAIPELDRRCGESILDADHGLKVDFRSRTGLCQFSLNAMMSRAAREDISLTFIVMP